MRQVFAAVLLLACVGPLASAVPPGATSRPALTFKNPLKTDGADPWMTYFDGWYYLTTTTNHDLRMRRARTVGGLREADDQVVWDGRSPEPMDRLWAAEFHRMKDPAGQNRWYGYYTAVLKAPGAVQQMYVIESDGDAPMGPYHFKAKLTTDPAGKVFAVDGSPVFGRGGQMAFVWAASSSDTGIGLFIDRMIDPWTLSGRPRPLPANGFGISYVREGPVALYHGDRVFLTYSMCGAPEPDYRLGMLYADAGDDLSDPSAWKQYPAVVFARNDAVGVYGPGHNFFFKSPDGAQDWIVYHAKTTTEHTYDDRTCRAQPFAWDAGGFPVFGKPLSTDTPIDEPSGTLTR